MNQENNLNQNLDQNNNLNTQKQPMSMNNNNCFIDQQQNQMTNNIPMQQMNWQQQYVQQQYMQPQYIPVQQMPMQQMVPMQVVSQGEVQKPKDKDVKLFKNERNWTTIKLIILSIALLVTLGITGLFVYCAVLPEKNVIPNFNPYYLIPLGIFDLITFAFWILSIVKVKNWNHTISAICNSQSEKINSSHFIKNFFKSSIRWNISLNWLCGYIYLAWLAAILFAFISSYFTAVYYLGGHNAPAFGTVDWSDKIAIVPGEVTEAGKTFAKLPFYTLVFGSVAVGVTIIVQVLNIVIFNIRRKALNTNFEEVFTYEEYNKIFKKANKINFIIYCSLTLIFVIVLIVFFILAKKLFK